MSSPRLQAKKAARDAKRKKLEAMFHQHTETEQKTAPEEVPAFAKAPKEVSAGESSSEATPAYSSYQHDASDAVDLEQGGGHVVMISSNEEEKGRLLREQAQTWVHMENEGRIVSSQSDVVVQRVQENKKTISAFFLFLFLWWWL